MNIRPIRTELEHQQALAEIERIWDAEPGDPEHDRLEVLGMLVNAYEDQHWPIEPGDPIDAIKFQMEQTGHTQADLAALLGSRSRASEILNRKRPLTLEMVAKLHHDWRIPADCLIPPAPKVSAARSPTPKKPRSAKRRALKAKPQKTRKKAAARKRA